jgi:uncharacterized protein YgiM (DUF1202 family)
VRLLTNVLGLVGTSQLSWISLILFTTANGLFIWHILARHRALPSQALIGGVVFGALFLCSACALSWKIYEGDFSKEGVVIEQKVDVRSGPGTDNLTIFTIHEGIKVRVRESNGGWLQVNLPNGWNGWLPQSTVALL